MVYLRLIVIALTGVLLISCTVLSEVKAPCDYKGHFCGQKIRINH